MRSGAAGHSSLLDDGYLTIGWLFLRCRVGAETPLRYIFPTGKRGLEKLSFCESETSSGQFGLGLVDHTMRRKGIHRASSEWRLVFFVVVVAPACHRHSGRVHTAWLLLFLGTFYVSSTRFVEVGFAKARREQVYDILRRCYFVDRCVDQPGPSLYAH